MCVQTMFSLNLLPYLFLSPSPTPPGRSSLSFSVLPPKIPRAPSPAPAVAVWGVIWDPTSSPDPPCEKFSHGGLQPPREEKNAKITSISDFLTLKNTNQHTPSTLESNDWTIYNFHYSLHIFDKRLVKAWFLPTNLQYSLMDGSGLAKVKVNSGLRWLIFSNYAWKHNYGKNSGLPHSLYIC